MCLLGCDRADLFEMRTTYQSVDDPARSYEVRAEGVRPAGADVAEDYRATIVVAAEGQQHALRIRAESFVPTVTSVESEEGAPVVVGETVDPGLLARFIAAADPGAPSEVVEREAAELVEALEAAGAGPKAGLSEGSALRLLSSSSDYL